MPIDAQYPFDPTGTLLSNKITGEQHIITPVNYRDYNFFVPRFAPYFANNLTISYKNSLGQSVTLTENVDYYLTHWFISASRACSKPIYGSITLLNNDLNGVMTITYQTLGGDWNIDDQLIAQILADQINNPRTTSWDSVSEMPYAFPVIDHAWDLVDMVGATEVVDKLDNITNAILDQNSASGLGAHLADFNNPHEVTAAQTGAYTTAQADAKFLAIGAEAADSAKFDGKNYVEAKADILTGKAADSAMFDGKTYQDLIDEIGTLEVGNAQQFEGRTFAQATTEILSGVAADAARFDGMTPAEFDQRTEDVVATSLKVFKRVLPTYISTDPMSIDSWSLICRFKMSLNNNPGDIENSVHLLIDSSDYITEVHNTTYDVIVHTRAVTPQLDVRISATGDTPSTFGVSYDSVADEYSLWLKTKSARPPVSIFSIGGGNIYAEADADSTTDTEPAAIDYTYSARSTEGYVSIEAFAAALDQLTTTFTGMTH